MSLNYSVEMCSQFSSHSGSGNSDSKKKMIIVATSTSGSLFFLSCLLIICIVGGTMYRYKKKKRKTVGEDEYHLLPQDDDNIEFWNCNDRHTRSNLLHITSCVIQSSLTYTPLGHALFVIFHSTFFLQLWTVCIRYMATCSCRPRILNFSLYITV